MTWLPPLVFGMLAWLISWGAWVTLQIMAYKATCLTRAEHVAVCDKKDSELNVRFDKLEQSLDQRLNLIQTTLKEQNDVYTAFRHTQQNTLTNISTQLAVANKVAELNATAAAAQIEAPSPRKRTR